ncbi:MAG: SDR family oxidoreductase [Deltaproteobacteria bacterium]|nr:SDR family oxidoreductase [Deltaproteobacteria bacterium]
MRGPRGSLPKRDFHGKAVVITGGAGGIGRALAASFAREGARIALLDLASSPLVEACEALESAGAEALAIPCDVTDPAQCAAAMQQVREAWGGVDVLVNNAGMVHRSAFSDTSLEVFRRVMEVNFFGSLHCAQAALPDLMERRGLIVVTSSIAGMAPLYGRSGYAASKHALHGLFESARSELAGQVGVLMVCPSFTASGFEKAAVGADGNRIDRPRSKVGRLASAESVADAVVRAAQADRRLLVLSPVGKLSALLSRVTPRLYERLMVGRLRKELKHD